MTTTDTIALTRRSLLAAGGALCATCAAGCATYGTQSAAPSSPAPAQSPQSAAPAPQQAAPAGIAAVADIPVGGGTVFADQGVVVTQPTQGTFAAFDATCPHAGCKVNEVVDGSISCPCHGSKFAVADGAPTTGPATTALGPRQVSVQGDRIVLA
ncbi:Rieske (2Fe-2S) protein [Pseudonocardia endophytica]|uniref:Nitrite reductase/ring-hydroxylating ferredoxin subunit n=1 Tax=Pseudonocardia endophytica TaxID=401976 RepID=A0A4R1I3Z8_PSEEN|nr:Rieske (2Fe-2S) protein [Pseudonocardia endophytica]TCK27249.1 nitrite reductase/ring-hydroxylating ferredoxin subunit [Pseudonocardia endophytica]